MRQPEVSRRQVEMWVSTPRLNTYARRTVPPRVIDEYVWAARLSSAYMELIAHVEVLLRNTIHAELSAQQNGPDAWFDDNQYVRLNGTALNSIRKTRNRITSSGHTPTPDRIVAGLSLDFWRFLFVNTHQIDVWRRIRRGFHGLPGSRRSTNHFAIVEQCVIDVYDLRNRVAHHEPIRPQEAVRNHESILLLAEYIDPNARRWLESISQVWPILASRPGRPPRPASLESEMLRRRHDTRRS